MADQERARRGLRLGDRQEIGSAFQRGCNCASVEGRDPKPVKHKEVERGTNRAGLGDEAICSLQRGNGFGIRVAFAGHQRCGQRDVDIELKLVALASFGQPAQYTESPA